MKTVIKNGTIINPGTKMSAKADLLIENDHIVSIGENLDDSEANCINANGCYVTPGLVDIHVHFRDPGFPDKETIYSGTCAAAAGGVTTVLCMPNTRPTVDNVATLRYVLDKGREGVVRVYSTASITIGLKGEQITDMVTLAKAGAVTFTDDGRSVMDPTILYEAFRLAAELDVPITSHCEEHNLVRSGAINRGDVSRLLGDVGIPALAEDLVVARDILFAETAGARLHIQHVTTKRAVQLIREAKARGVRVTAEAMPHHFSVTDEIITKVGAFAKVNPPLRTQSDVDAIIEGLLDGTVDVIATDHAPHTFEEKSKGLTGAPFGFVGLETSVGLTFTNLVHRNLLSVEQVIEKMTVAPAKVMGFRPPSLTPGQVADVTIIDPNLEWSVDPKKFLTKARHSPFAGWTLRGKAVMTIVGGKIVYTHEQGLMV